MDERVSFHSCVTQGSNVYPGNWKTQGKVGVAYFAKALLSLENRDLVPAAGKGYCGTDLQI